MSKSKVTYNVTSQDADGNFHVAEGVTDAPLKGDTFEYEHREVRVGHVVRVERVTIDEDDNVEVENVTELGDTHHRLEDPEVGDELPTPDELAEDPADEDRPPSTGYTEAGTIGAQ